MPCERAERSANPSLWSSDTPVAARRLGMNLPNILTLVRIFLVPLLVVVLLTRTDGFELWGVAILLGAAATDWLDGFLARRRRQVTSLGVVLDPIADKILISAAFITLVELDLAPAWMVALIIGREFAITGLRSYAHTRGISMPASPLGKIKMASQVTAILLLILGWGPLPWLAPIGHVALWVVMVAAVASAVDYYRRFQRLVNARGTDVSVARETTKGTKVSKVTNIKKVS